MLCFTKVFSSKDQLKYYYLLPIRHYKLSLLNQFLEGHSVMAAWARYFFKKNFFFFFHFSAPLKCHWPIRASSLKSRLPAGRIYSPLATGRVLMKRLLAIHSLMMSPPSCVNNLISVRTTLLFKNKKLCGLPEYENCPQSLKLWT